MDKTIKESTGRSKCLI